MKQRDLIKHLKRHGCEFLLEGGSHTVYINRTSKKCSVVPRHRKVLDFTAKKICKDLDIPLP